MSPSTGIVTGVPNLPLEIYVPGVENLEVIRALNFEGRK